MPTMEANETANQLDLVSQSIPLDFLRESPLNPRKRYDEHKLQDLAASIRAKTPAGGRLLGVLEPLIVRKTLAPQTGTLVEVFNGQTEQADDSNSDIAVDIGNGLRHSLEVVAGSRRLRAALRVAAELKNGSDTVYCVPCRIMELDDTEALELMIIENQQRDDVHPMEEAAAYAVLLTKPNYDIALIALKVGKEETYVRRRLSLNGLIDDAQSVFLNEPRFTLAHALLLCRLQPVDQEGALSYWVEQTEDNWRKNVPSATDLSSWIHSNILLDLHAASFPKDATLVPAAGACQDCTKRSGYAPALFPELGKTDMCLDARCFEGKQAAYLVRLETETDRPLPRIAHSYSYSSNTKGLLTRDKYVLIEKKADHCANIENAVMSDEHAPNHGAILRICRTPDCEKHKEQFSHRSSGPNAPATSKLAERTREMEEAIKKAQKSAMIEAIYGKYVNSKAGPMAVKDLRMVCQFAWSEVYHEDRKKICRDILPVEPVHTEANKESHSGAHTEYDTPVADAIEKWNTQELDAFLLVLALEHFEDRKNTHLHGWQDFGEENDKKSTVLELTCRSYRVDADKVKEAARAKVEAEWNKRIGRLQKAAAAEAETKAAKTAATSKAKKPAAKAAKKAAKKSVVKRAKK